MTKIVVIGAGSASFGLNTLATLLRSPNLHGASLALVDHNAQTLELVGALAEKLNHEWAAQMHISTHSQHREALMAADFVILSIEVSPREKLWKMDFQIPLKYGVRQPYAENGGPGGFAHAARNIGPVMEIARDMEQLCPQALLINYTNPMMRVCDALNRYSSIQAVGLCHQIGAGYAMVAKALGSEYGFDIPEGFIDCHASPATNPLRAFVVRQAMPRLHIIAAGLNHFTWMLALRDRKTGQDLYASFKECWDALPASFEPLTRRVYQVFGLFPIPGDEHLCEYLPWVSNLLTQPWEKFDLSLYDWDYWGRHRGVGYETIEKMASGLLSIDTLRKAASEGALELIENIANLGRHDHLAVNLPNSGQIPNLPDGAIVETPGLVTGAGVAPVPVDPLPEPVAELCRREITVVRLCVDAAVTGDRQAALQCLLLDPVISDMDQASEILDDYLVSYREHLPQFWE